MGEIVDCELFYCIKDVPSNPHPPILLASQLSTGAGPNPFFRQFDRQIAWPVPKPNGETVQVSTMQMLKEIELGTIEAKQEDYRKIAGFGAVATQHYFSLARELILEMTRVETAPKAPSRLQCLWFAESETDAKRWANEVQQKDGPVPRLAKVRATGTIHLGDASLLPKEGEALSVSLENARQYWRGTRSLKPLNEIIFHGAASVVEILE